MLLDYTGRNFSVLWLMKLFFLNLKLFFLFLHTFHAAMPQYPRFLTEEDVKSVLEWDSLFNGIKQIMKDVSTKNGTEESTVIQPSRSFMQIPNRNGVLLTMPGLSERIKILSCKLVTSFVNNPTHYGLPSILANVLVLDSDTGKLKAVLEGNAITEWRTAAASAVATHALNPNAGKNQTLAVFGAGRQGRIHIIAFQHFFKFKKVKLWNRTHQKGLKLAEELKNEFNIEVEVFTNATDCAKDADVIVTATYASEPILKYNQLKKGVIINAVGAGIRHHCELDKSIYQKSSIYTDSIENAQIELKGLIEEGFPILGEIGEIMNGSKNLTINDVIIFHSLGMALEDGAAAQIVLEKYKRKTNV